MNAHADDCRAVTSPRYPQAWDLPRCPPCRTALGHLSPSGGSTALPPAPPACSAGTPTT